MTTIRELYGTGIVDGIRFGIEVEVERVNNEPEGMELRYWRCTDDHSLRNNGKEFVSIPLSAEAVADALEEVQSVIDDGEYHASYRCGVHVHLNVGHLTTEQVYSLFLTYLAFERCLFLSAGESRDQSLFAVPLANTAVLSKVRQYRQSRSDHSWLAHMVNQDENSGKYLALNVIPIRLHGTVEFRHHAGTTDMQEVRTWCRILYRLYMLSQTEGSIERIMSANTQSTHAELLREVFGQEYMDNAQYQSALKFGVRLVKQVN